MRRTVSLFQRIKTPFGERAEDDFVQPPPFSSAIGALLRERREELGLDLDTIGEELRIRPVYLAALEQGRAQDLPGPTYAIGFIRAYAHHLGLDGERVLARYKAESAGVHTHPDLALPVPLGERSLPGSPILLVGVILALCGYGTWYYLSTGERSRPERVAAVPAELRQAAQAGKVTPAGPAGVAPSVTASPQAPTAATAATPPLGSGLPQQEAPPRPEAPTVGHAAGSPNPGFVANPAAAAPSPPATAPPEGGVTPKAVPAAVPTSATAATGAAAGTGIDIRAVADCWIQVRAGDTQAIVFSRVLKAGQTYHVPRPGLLLRTGNAGVLAIAVDGKPAPPIGRIGTLRRDVALDPAELLAGTAVHG